LEWFIFLLVPCYKMHQKNFLLLWFTFLSKPEMNFLPLMIPSYNFEIQLKKKTTVSSSCVGSSINFYFINRNGLPSSYGSFLLKKNLQTVINQEPKRWLRQKNFKWILKQKITKQRHCGRNCAIRDPRYRGQMSLNTNTPYTGIFALTNNINTG
jgi:hypothetical protein